MEQTLKLNGKNWKTKINKFYRIDFSWSQIEEKRVVTSFLIARSQSLYKMLKAGVSNWHFEGRMRPANMVCAARDEDKNEKIF